MERGRLRYGLALVVPALLAAGCLLPYAYPKLDYVPGKTAPGISPSFHAFRVDITADQADMGETGEYAITEITPRADGSIPSQTRLSVERGFYFAGIVLNYNVGRFHSTRVRLYSPEYQLIELGPWDSPDATRWQPAEGWAAQEKAIDDLLSRPVLTDVGVAERRRKDAPVRKVGETGLTWPNRRTIEFLAAEYERVASLAPIPEDAARLRGKAEELRNPRFLPAPVIHGTPDAPTTPESP